jgi:hypothetical protein
MEILFSVFKYAKILENPTFCQIYKDLIELCALLLLFLRKLWVESLNNLRELEKMCLDIK